MSVAFVAGYVEGSSTSVSCDQESAGIGTAIVGVSTVFGLLSVKTVRRSKECKALMREIKVNYYMEPETPIPVPVHHGVEIDHYKIPLRCNVCGGPMQHVNAPTSTYERTNRMAVAKCATTKCGYTFTIQVIMRKMEGKPK